MPLLEGRLFCIHHPSKENTENIDESYISSSRNMTVSWRNIDAKSIHYWWTIDDFNANIEDQ